MLRLEIRTFSRQKERKKIKKTFSHEKGRPKLEH